MTLTNIWEGPTVLAEMLRGALSDHGIRSVLQAREPFLAVIGEAAQAPFSAVLIDADEQLRRSDQVAECLALLLPVEEDESEFREAE